MLRKYLLKIFLWFVVSILLIVSIFSFIIYFNAEKILLDNEYITSKKILSQVKYNIDMIDASIKNFCVNIYMNPDIISLMNDVYKDNDQIDLMLKVHKLKSSVEWTNSFLHSVTVYNYESKQFYNIGSTISQNFEDIELKKIFAKYPNLPKLIPISRKIMVEQGEKDQYENVFTYFMYESSINSSARNGVVVVNVKSEWLFDNIKIINMIEKNKQDSIYLLDQTGEFVDNQNKDEAFNNSLKSEFIKNKSLTIEGENTGFFETELKGEKYVVTYVNVENGRWSLLKIQPSREVFKSIYDLKEKAVKVTVVFLLLTIIVSLIITNRVYKPLGKLLSNISLGSLKKAGDEKIKDEISYLNNVYTSLNAEINILNMEKYQSKNIMKIYWLKKLLIGAIDKELFEEIAKKYSLSLPYDGCFTVCIAKIDDFETFKTNNSLKERELVRFAIINIMGEMILEKYLFESIDMGEDHIALIISLSNGADNDFEIMDKQLIMAQEYIIQHFEVSVTVSIGNIITSLKLINNSYTSALKISMYRFIYGKTSVLTPDKVKLNLNNMSIGYPHKLDLKLVENIKSANIQSLNEVLLEISNFLSEINYDNIVVILVNMVNTIWKSVNEGIKSAKNAASFNFIEINRSVFELETKKEFFELLESSLKDVLTVTSDEGSDLKNKVIVDTVVNIINKNYPDSTLCFNQIAAMLKIYPRRLARIFKETEQVSIPEYINNVRLEKASELLEKTGFSVYEIIEKVGIENETYFYSIFKKKYGTTPKDYALMKRFGTIK
jgi:AraC-type DNA-binding domain-containing proteins